MDPIALSGGTAIDVIDGRHRTPLEHLVAPTPLGPCVGEVEEIGEGGDGWTEGQRVLVDPVWTDPETGRFQRLGENRPGALAEYCVVHHSQLIALPESRRLDRRGMSPRGVRNRRRQRREVDRRVPTFGGTGLLRQVGGDPMRCAPRHWVPLQ